VRFSVLFAVVGVDCVCVLPVSSFFQLLPRLVVSGASVEVLRGAGRTRRGGSFLPVCPPVCQWGGEGRPPALI